MATQRIVILGGEHAGVPCARRLLRARRASDDIEIVLISDENVEVWHGLMPQIVSGVVQPTNALTSLREMLPGVKIYPYSVKAVDLAGRTVRMSPGDERDDLVLTWDYLVFALGSVTDMSRFPGLLEHGFQTKTMGDIIYLRNRLIDMLERASVEPDPEERRRMLTFVVAGGGFAGVEIGSQSNEFLHAALRFYPDISPSDIKVMLVSSGPRILPALSERLARRGLRYMQRHNIDVRLNTGVRSVTVTTAELSTGEVIPTRTAVVTIGVAPHPLLKDLPVETTAGRITTDLQCRVPGQRGVYAGGDNAAIPDTRTGKLCPQTALFAFSEGAHIANNILAEIRGRQPRRFRYRAIGELAFLGTSYAVSELRGIPIDGRLAVLIGRGFWLVYTPTWRRRIALIFDWLSAAIFARDVTQVSGSRSDTIVPMRFGAGEAIVREGDPGTRFYVISDGECEVVRRTADGGEEVLERLGPGRYFGEIALLHDVRRTATVRATKPTTVLSIARQEFSTLVQHLPVLREAFEQRAQTSLQNMAGNDGVEPEALTRGEQESSL